MNNNNSTELNGASDAIACRPIIGLLVFRKPAMLSLCIALLYGLVLSGYPLMANILLFAGIQDRIYSVALHVAIFLLSIVVVLFLGIERNRIYRGILWLPISMFWIIYIARITLDTVFLSTPLKLPGYEYYVLSIAGSLIPMTAFMVIADAVDIDKAFRFTFYFSLAAVLILMLNVVYLEAVVIYWLQLGRLGTENLNPISVGHLSATLAILSIFRIANLNSASLTSRLFSVIFIICGIAILILSASKGPILAFLVTILMYTCCVNLGKRGNINLFLINGVLLTTVSIVVFYMAFEFDTSVANRISQMLSGDSQGVMSRITMLSAAWDMFLSNPLFGGGLELVEYKGYPHNVIVESFMATGVFGGTAFLVLVLAAFVCALRIISRNDRYSWVGLLYLQYMVASMVSGALYNSSIMWAMMGSVFGISYFIFPYRWRIFEDSEIRAA